MKAQPGDGDVAWTVDHVDANALHPFFLTPNGRPHTLMLFSAEFFPEMLIEAATNLPFVQFSADARWSRGGHRQG